MKTGKGVVVGAGSLITRDLDDNYLYVGRPAKKSKKLEYNDTQETILLGSLLRLFPLSTSIHQSDDTLGENDQACDMSPFI